MLLNKIIYYPRKSLKKSLKEVMKSKNRMIAGKFSPQVFNMPYEEISIKSIDGINLYGWLIKSENAKKTIILCHGRENNRISCLKFLQIFKYLNLEEKYNIFLPDLRNSGKSDVSKTAFGYYFAKDIYSITKHLKDEYSFNNFSLYGFSQGAMGVAAMPFFFEKELKENDIKIDKLILDSPVSNVSSIIIKNSYIAGIKIPFFIILGVLNKLNKLIDNNLSNMCLSKLLGRVPTLIIQSEKDYVTPYSMLLEEYDKLSEEARDMTSFKAFRKGQHVRIYLEYKQEYTKTIYDFLEGGIDE